MLFSASEESQQQLPIEDPAPELPISEDEEVCGSTATFYDEKLDGNDSSDVPESEDGLGK